MTLLVSCVFFFFFFFFSFWQFIKHRHKLAHIPVFRGRKKQKTTNKKKIFSSKQRGNKLKFRTTSRGPAYPVFREAGGGRREGGKGRWRKGKKEEKWRWRGEEAYTGGIRTKASLAPAGTLMRVQIHYWLINHDTL